MYKNIKKYKKKKKKNKINEDKNMIKNNIIIICKRRR